MKEKWEEPELIVIIKTELEEDVMAACKTDRKTCNTEQGGPANAYASS